MQLERMIELQSYDITIIFKCVKLIKVELQNKNCSSIILASMLGSQVMHIYARMQKA